MKTNIQKSGVIFKGIGQGQQFIKVLATQNKNDIKNKKRGDMKITDGRGKHTKIVEKENLEKVKDFFNKHPNKTQTDCSKYTGLSLTTIRKHLKTMGYL